MDCHLNCHGELNALLPFLGLVPLYVVRVARRVRAWSGR